jgi:long-chain acyl-CoA synthetase
MGPCIVSGASLVLGYRFDVDQIVELIERYRPTFTIGAITAFIALMNHEAIEGRDLSSLVKVYSGGAPIAPTTVDDFQRRVGPYIHNIYGLTEATGPCLATPLGARSPVDAATGALAAGVPVSNTEVRLVRDDGTDAAPGEPGEVAMRGPGVVPGYWRKPEETANAIRDGWLFTGDVAVSDERGWYYIVDRLKDQINASGFKVWPREVEDALMAHPDVVEAAVVGVPDAYRGETVKGFVVLVPGATTTPTDLVGFCRERLAAYKYPRIVELVDALPRNASGKILRRELRSG